MSDATQAGVLIVGAGPAGLSAAAELAAHGTAVRVVDRDDAPGGVPRHSAHPGYGLREARLLSGPAYARRLTDRALAAGARIDVCTTVTRLIPIDGGGAQVEVTSPDGRESVMARAVLLAAGCRERARAARLVPGDRPSGVITTGWLQRLVHLDHGSPGHRAVVVGAEHVSYSAVVTLAEAGCRTVAMVTDAGAHTSFAAFDVAARARYRFPLLTSTRIGAIHGSGTVTGVTLEHADGRRAHVACDTVVFTGDWYPENELAMRAGLALDAVSHAPVVDTSLRASARGVFAAGNITHPAATADACAADGRQVAIGIRDWLAGSGWPAATAPVRVEHPLLWCSPGRIALGDRSPLRLQTAVAVDRPRLVVTQADQELWSGRLPWIRPTRPFALPARATEGAAGTAALVVRIDR